jgi:hypothetical protein
MTSRKSRKSGYHKLTNRGDDIEMTQLGESKSFFDVDKILAGTVVHSKKEAIRDHDVYARTRTMPN